MSIYLLNDDFEMLADQLGVLPIQSLREDVFNQFQHFNGSFADFIKARRADKPHWFEPPKPEYTTEHPALYNISEQGKYLRENGADATLELLQKGGLKKLGDIKPAPKIEADDIKGANNPWSDECKLSAAEKERRISSFIRSNPTDAARLARSAGKTLTGQNIQVIGQPFRDPRAARK
jgi:hypothetical protein